MLHIEERFQSETTLSLFTVVPLGSLHVSSTDTVPREMKIKSGCSDAASLSEDVPPLGLCETYRWEGIELG